MIKAPKNSTLYFAILLRMRVPSFLYQQAWGLLLQVFPGSINEETANQGQLRPGIYFSALQVPGVSGQSLDEINNGYSVDSAISQKWGNGSPYFAQNSSIPADIPAQCTITFAQILSRHGARDPTAGKTTAYNKTIAKIKSNVDLNNLPPSFAFLKDFKYTLGADQLTTFGGQELINSGIKFYDRYKSLASANTIFVRASGELRVVQSAGNFTVGYEAAKANKAVTTITPSSATTSALPILVISEDAGSNNTLNHDLCTVFENGPDSTINDNAQLIFQDTFIPPIQARFNMNLPGANLSAADMINLMDLCSFETVALPTADPVSPFCGLFTQAEWNSYDYYESLGTWYGFGAGNPLGPTQGVGWTNELIARLTNSKVVDHTSTNTTLTNSNATFPLGLKLYADFSHDNEITAIMFAMGLFNGTTQLSNTTQQTLEQTNGYSASTTVPFSARMYVEKMSCNDQHGNSSKEELVRVLINDRVVPLQNCGADELGRCTVTKFVDSLTFARSGGLWDQCFSSPTKGTAASSTGMAAKPAKPKNGTDSPLAMQGNSTGGLFLSAASTTCNKKAVAGYSTALVLSFFMFF